MSITATHALVPSGDVKKPNNVVSVVCRYCDAFVEKDNLYIVMEFAEHGDISRQTDKFKKANKYIKEDTIWSYTIQICQAVYALHSRNILHRVSRDDGEPNGRGRPRKHSRSPALLLLILAGYQAEERLFDRQEPRAAGRPRLRQADEGWHGEDADR